VQPRSRESPIIVYGSARYAEYCRTFADGVASKVPEHHDLSESRRSCFELFKCLMHRENLSNILVEYGNVFRKLAELVVATTLLAVSLAGIVYSNSAHGAGCRREEVTMVFKCVVARLKQAKIRLMNKFCRLQRLSFIFERDLVTGDATEFIVHECQQRTTGFGVPVGDAMKKLRDN